MGDNQLCQKNISERPYKCDTCFQTYTRKWNMNEHKKIHSQTRTIFKCVEFSKSFADKSSLRRHLHIHTNEPLFECKIWKKEFKRKSDLNRHIQTHSEERKFKCTLCEWASKT